jgi:hypothetical protein
MLLRMRAPPPCVNECPSLCMPSTGGKLCKQGGEKLNGAAQACRHCRGEAGRNVSRATHASRRHGRGGGGAEGDAAAKGGHERGREPGRKGGERKESDGNARNHD